MLATVRVDYLSKIVNKLFYLRHKLSAVIPWKKDVILGGRHLIRRSRCDQEKEEHYPRRNDQGPKSSGKAAGKEFRQV